MKSIVCKCRILLQCESIQLRVVRQQGCKLQANEPASYQVKSLSGC